MRLAEIESYINVLKNRNISDECYKNTQQILIAILDFCINEQIISDYNVNKIQKIINECNEKDLNISIKELILKNYTDLYFEFSNKETGYLSDRYPINGFPYKKKHIVLTKQNNYSKRYILDFFDLNDNLQYIPNKNYDIIKIYKGKFTKNELIWERNSNTIK